MTGDHQNRVTDYTPVVVLALGATNANASMTDGDKAPTMLARAGTGGGNEPIVLMRIEHEQDKLPNPLGCAEQTDIQH